MNGYIIVLPEGILNSVERANHIARNLYNISRPVVIQSEREKDYRMFGVIVHPDGVQAALQVDTSFVIYVHEAANLERLTACFPELTEQERYSLTAYIQTNDKFPFGHIVPSTTTVRDHQYMVDNGWFPDIEDVL